MDSVVRRSSVVFFFKQKTAYEIRPCDWSSDVCSSDLPGYWRDLEKTRTAFLQYPGPRGQGRRIYKTEDLARLGDDGLVYYVARADTQIKSRGETIDHVARVVRQSDGKRSRASAPGRTRPRR